MTKRTTRKAAESAGTVVYCGPSIKGVAKQFTAYNNGIPEGLKAATEKNKVLAALIVFVPAVLLVVLVFALVLYFFFFRFL